MPKSIADKIKTDVLLLVCQLSNKSIDDNLIELWIMALSDLSHEQLNKGMQRTAREYKGTFLMPPAQFREYCLTGEGENTEDEASHAFDEMIKRYTCTRSAYFKNPITAEIMRGIGTQMRTWETKDLPFKKKDFIKDYKVLKTRGEEYNPVIYKDGDANPRFIGEFDDLERSQAKLEFNRYILLEDHTQPDKSTNQARFKGLLERLK